MSEHQKMRIEEMKRDFYRRHNTPFDFRFWLALVFFATILLVVITLYV